MAFQIYLSPPYMGGKEMQFIQDAFDTNWIAPTGPSVSAFEREMAAYLGIGSALALSSGTAAIHLALRWLGVSQGDTVFCQDFTFIGSCAPILYQHANPVFIDSEKDTWNMSPAALERAFQWAEAEHRMPKAVLICDLYGEPADWDALLPICRKYGVPVIEDAAEAIGAQYKGKKCGTLADIGILSFNGNKVITTSGGGMVVSDDRAAVEKMGFWATQAREPFTHYEHKDYGYNYRLSNICACIGRGQLTILEEKLAMRRHKHEVYTELFKNTPAHIKREALPDTSNYWLNLLMIDDPSVMPDAVVKALHAAQIEGRPVWKPMHMQPVFANALFAADATVYERGIDCVSSISGELFRRAVCLPSGDALTDAQLHEITDTVLTCFGKSDD